MDFPQTYGILDRETAGTLTPPPVKRGVGTEMEEKRALLTVSFGTAAEEAP